MAIITKPNTFTNNTVADSAAVNADFDTIFNDYNGNITDANIANTGITTYGKVQGAALTALVGINAGAGVIPTANLPTNLNTTGTASNVTGTVAIAHGGTGQVTAQAAIDALLPAQGAATGKFLTSNGSASSWGAVNSYIAYITGVYQESSFSTSRGSSAGSYTKVKESSPMIRGGVLSVSFKATTGTGSGGTSYARIYVNGSAIGTERSALGDWGSTYAEDITVVQGDIIQIYVYNTNSRTVSITNFQTLCANPTIAKEATNY